MSASAAAAAAAAGSPNILLVNSPLGYVGTLGRAGMGNNSLEVQLNQHHANHYSANYLNHLSGNKEYGGSPLSAEQQMMMKTAAAASSNEALSSDDNVAPLHAVSANASHIAANYATGGSSSGTHSHHHHHNSSSNNNTPSEETKRAIAQYEQKIRRTKELIKEEQMRCNENVNEYLKLSANAELSQGQRIKSVFEKNNQKSAQRISKYQKKLKRYDQCIKDIKERGIYYRHTRERLRDLGTNVKEGISGLSGGVIEGIKSGIHTAGETVIVKPKEFFKRNTTDSSNDKNNSLDHDQNHMGNAQNSADQGGGDQQGGNSGGGLINSNSHTHSHSTKCTSDDESSSITSGSGQLGATSHNNSIHHSNSPLRVKPVRPGNKLTAFDSITPTTHHTPVEFYTVAEMDQLRQAIDERGQECGRLNNEITLLKTQFQTDCSLISQSLQDEKYRVERLEEQLNDLTELHQKEIENLKQTITDLEEKIQYQTEERHRDVHEMLESFQTRISRMEHQQHQHLQQLVNLDSLDNSNARALVLKLINVLLTILQVVLLLVATIANILSPFLHTRMRIFTSAIVIILFTFVFQHWPELSLWTRQKIYENCYYVLSLIPFFSINPDG